MTSFTTSVESGLNHLSNEFPSEIQKGPPKPDECTVEGKWAAKFSVAQTSIREAIEIIAQAEFVSKIPSHSARVIHLSETDVDHKYPLGARLRMPSAPPPCGYLWSNSLTSISPIAREREVMNPVVSGMFNKQVVSVPTATYSDERAVNISNHFVFGNPYYAIVYERKKAVVSARLHYLSNSANDDPFVGLGIRSMQPGQAFHMNYSVSYEVLKNARLNFNGYGLQQLTDHEMNGMAVPNSKERTVGLGPGLQLGGRDIWFHLDGYIETDVRNRPSGIKVTVRISKAIPARDANH